MEPTPEVIDGLTVKPLILGAAKPREPGVLYFYRFGKYAGDGTSPEVQWRYTTLSGSEWEGDLLANLPTGAAPWSLASSDGYGIMAVANCLKGFCGGYGIPSTDSEGELLISRDGGISWQNLGPLPRYSDLIGILHGQVLVSTATEPTKSDYALALYPSRESVRREPDAYPSVMSGIGLVWQRQGGDLLTGDGEILWHQTLGQYHRLLRFNSDGSRWESWIGSTAEGQRRYIAKVKPSGDRERIYSWDGDIWFSWFTDDMSAGGNVYLARPTTSNPYGYLFPGVTIDLESGVVHPIEGFDLQGQTAFVRAATVGPYLRVTGTGSCLNVRAEPRLDAPVLECVRDGTLLTWDAASQASLRVETPSGIVGWAREEYLER